MPMTFQWRRPRWLCVCCAVVASVVVAGCRAPEPLPEQQWRGLAQALDTIEQRHQRINTLSAECKLTLRQTNGDNVSLDGVMIVERPNRMRAQAWKFDQKVIDLAVRGDGVWVWASERMETDNQNAPDFAQAPGGDWLNALFELPDADEAQVIQQGGPAQPMIVRWRRGRHASTRGIQLTIDRPTLTVRAFDVLDKDGDTLHRVTLGRYRLFNNIPLPTRIEAASDERSMTLRLSAVRLNEPLPDGAFTPPPDAERRR